MYKKIILILFIGILLSGCNTLKKGDANQNTSSSYQVYGKTYHVLNSSKNYEEKGLASWYGSRFHKKRTSSGERYNMYKLTAAHKTLPLDSYVLVTNIKNGKQVVVKVNDRGPFVRNRLIDLSYAAAKKLGILGLGTAAVNVKAVEKA